MPEKPELFMVQIKDIIPGDRARQVYKGLEELAKSMQKVGVIHPIVVTPTENGKFKLVAGGRRFRASIFAGFKEIPATLQKGNELLCKEIEYEENACRQDVTFEEEARALEAIHKLKQKEDPKWGMVNTAELTGRSLGDVGMKIKVAQKFRERPDLKEKCKDKPLNVARKIIEQTEAAERIGRLADSGQIDLTTDLGLGDCRTLIKDLTTESVDILVTDPPYGIERLEKLRDTNLSMWVGHQLMSDSHNRSLKEILETLKELAPELHRVLKPGAHFYCFCGFQFISYFIEALHPHLEVQPPVLIWDKGRATGPAWGYNYMPRCEVILFGHRPPRGRRLNDSMFNLFSVKEVPRGIRMYPTEKPIELLEIFIKNSTDKGATVLDPFAGSASTLVAARRLGRRGVGFEANKESYLRAQERLNGE